MHLLPVSAVMGGDGERCVVVKKWVRERESKGRAKKT